MAPSHFEPHESPSPSLQLRRSHTDIQVMSLFARSRAESGSERYKRALEAALSVSEIASAAVVVPTAVQQVVSAALELFRAEQCSVMLLDEDGRDLVLVASAGLPHDIRPGHRVQVGEGVAGRVLVTGRSLLLGKVEHDDFINFVPKQRPIRSSLVAPLRVDGRSIGVLSLSTSTDDLTFTEEDRRLAQMFADQAANLINRTRLHEQAELRSAELAALVESSEKMLGTIDLDDLLQSILDGAIRFAGVKGGMACLIDPNTGAMTRGVFRGIDKESIREVTRHPESLAAADAGELRRFEVDGRSYLALGFRSSQGARGVMVIPGGDQIAAEKGHLLKAFGQQCSSALGAAELYSVVQRKESELASIIQSVTLPIVLADSEARIVSINASAEQLFGISSSFCQGAPVAGTLSHPELEGYLSGTGDLIGEVQVGVPPHFFKIRATDVRIPGAPMGRLLVMDDITSEREMTQTQHDFVAMIGHELRTPLTIVKGFTRLLLRRGDALSETDKHEALLTIDTKTAELERIVEDLLYVSGIESRESALRIDQVNVGEVFQSVAQELLEVHQDRRISIDIPEDLVWACDVTKLTIVGRHLIDNALKYSAVPDEVIIRVHEKDKELQFDIVDRGVGLVSSDIPGIFERFRQLDGSATREHGGMGVGLYLCARLVRTQEGRIWVDSAWGKGSTFSFTLPRRVPTDRVKNLVGRKAMQDRAE